MDGRAFGDDGACGFAVDELGERATVVAADVAAPVSLRSGGDAPGDVGDLIFVGAAGAGAGIAPVVLNDELLE